MHNLVPKTFPGGSLGNEVATCGPFWKVSSQHSTGKTVDQSFLSTVIPYLASNSRGKDGSVSNSLLQTGDLDGASKREFPVELLNIMRREAEDLLLTDRNSQQGRDALTFLLGLASARSDMEVMKKGMDGF